MNILDAVRQRILLLDGAMGTELMRAGLAPGQVPDAWNLERPDVVRDIHDRYYAAGADMVVTNTFGANPIKLAKAGLQDRVREINLAAAGICVEVRPSGKWIGGDIGPTGKFLKPQGEFEESEFEYAFFRQAEALAEGGVDVFFIETMYDLREALCAVRACRKAAPLPVFATMTYNRTPRGYFTLMGDPPGRCLQALKEAGVSAAGANCTLDSSDMIELTRLLRSETDLPLIIQPNAGQPQISETGGVVYAQSDDDTVRHVSKILENGARIIGGCCGTTPETIRRLAALLAGRSDSGRP